MLPCHSWAHKIKRILLLLLQAIGDSNGLSLTRLPTIQPVCGRGITPTFCYPANCPDSIPQISKPKSIQNIQVRRTIPRPTKLGHVKHHRHCRYCHHHGLHCCFSVQPETLHSTFDKPAQVTINLSRWYYDSHIYLVVTSYKYLKNGERCQEGKEFDCSPYNFLSANTDHMCMNTNLACDGLPNCGQNFLPNQVLTFLINLLGLNYFLTYYVAS